MSKGKKWPLISRMRLACCAAGVIYLPAAIGTLQLCFGMDAAALVEQKWLMWLMLLAVVTRLFFMPMLLMLLCIVTMVFEILKAMREDHMQWQAALTALAVVCCCTGLVSLEIFYQTIMGV